MTESSSDNLRLVRNPIWVNLNKFLAWLYVKTLSNKHYEIPIETIELMKHQKKNKDSSIYYAMPHKSMWEVVGGPLTISRYGGDMPFIMMGSNLIKKNGRWPERVLRYSLDHSGVVQVERDHNPKISSPKLVTNITDILSAKKNVFLFPEGTRSRSGYIKDFKGAGFQGLVDAVTSGNKCYEVDVNIDYSNLIELGSHAAENELDSLTPIILSDGFKKLGKNEKNVALRNLYNRMHFVKSEKLEEFADLATRDIGDCEFLSELDTLKGKYTFTVKDRKSWKIYIGDVYITFGKPRLIINGDDRKYLAKLSREACLDLVKIQKINVLSEAVVRMNPEFGAPIYNKELYHHVDDVVMDLMPYEDKFRGFTKFTRSSEIVEKSNIPISSEFMEAYKIHANNISHYMHK